MARKYSILKNINSNVKRRATHETKKMVYSAMWGSPMGEAKASPKIKGLGK